MMSQDTAAYEKVLKEFTTKFNVENIDGVQSLYASEMSEYMPVDKTTQFIKGMHQQFGNITGYEFIKDVEGVKLFHIIFEKGKLSLDLQLDAENKITGLVFGEL